MILFLAWQPVSISFAQSDLDFTNVPGVDLKLAPGSNIVIDGGAANGDLIVQCKLEAGACVGMRGSGNNGSPPTTILSRADLQSRLIPGSFVRLRWSSSQAAVCRVSQESGPSSTTWSGPRPAQFLAGEYVILPSAGTYAFSIRCYNASGASALSSLAATVVPREVSDPTPLPPPVIDPGAPDIPEDPVIPGYSCEHPYIEPAGFARRDLSWSEAWSAFNNSIIATYPNSPGFPVHIGADIGTYTVVPFVPTPGQTVNIFWDSAQAAPAQGYMIARPADSMAITISPCPGDLRAVDQPSPDHFLRQKCRVVASSASIVYSTRIEAQNSISACYLEPGKVYYMTFSPVEPLEGLSPELHTCRSVPSSATHCDVQARSSGNL